MRITDLLRTVRLSPVSPVVPLVEASVEASVEALVLALVLPADNST